MSSHNQTTEANTNKQLEQDLKGGAQMVEARSGSKMASAADEGAAAATPERLSLQQRASSSTAAPNIQASEIHGAIVSDEMSNKKQGGGAESALGAEERPFVPAGAAPAAASGAAPLDLSGPAFVWTLGKKCSKAKQTKKERAGNMRPSQKKAREQEAAAGAAAASSSADSPLQSPFQRIIPDPLSIALSFLSTHDFIRAVRVCKQWHSAGARQTAWPKLHLPSFIRSLQDGGDDGPSRRKLVIDSEDKERELLARPECMAMWRHVTELKLTGCPTLLQRLGDFPGLSALFLLNHPHELLAPALLSVVDRLESLVVPEWHASSHLPLSRLRSLRILVLNGIPNVAAALAELQQLQYFSVHGLGGVSMRSVTRWLSVHHQLRSLSCADFAVGRPDGFDPLLEVCDSSAIPTGVASDLLALVFDPPLDFRVPCGLTNMSFRRAHDEVTEAGAALLFRGLPRLTRLQWIEDNKGVVSLLPLASFDSLARLQELRLSFPRIKVEFDLDARLRPLTACTQLRVFMISSPAIVPSQPFDGKFVSPAPLAPFTTVLSMELLTELLAVWAPSVEEIRLAKEIDVEPQGQADSETLAHSLIQCQQLQSLSFRLQAGLSAALFRPLCRLPRLHTVHLTLGWGLAISVFGRLLRSMLSPPTPSWSRLHLHVLGAVDPTCPSCVPGRRRRQYCHPTHKSMRKPLNVCECTCISTDSQLRSPRKKRTSLGTSMA